MNCIELALYNEMLRKKKKRLDDRYKKPAFGVVTSLTGNATSGPILYNHNFTPVGRVETGGISTQMSELIHQASVKRSTQSYVYRSTVSSGTNMQGHVGHAMVALGDDYKLLARSLYHAENLRDVGTIVNNTKPSMAIFMREGKYWIGERTLETGKDSRMGYFFGLPGTSPTQDYGSIGFNEKTGTMAILLSSKASGDWKFRITSWDNLTPPHEFESSKDFFSQEGITLDNAKNSPEFVLPGNLEPKYLEGTGRAVVVVCDNGDIICSKMLPHQGFITFRVKNQGGNYVAPTSNLFFHHWTTTYGCEKGPLYGIRHVVSLDGKYIAAYAAAYYYGAGIRISIIRVSDGKVMNQSINDKHYGYQVIPVNESDFMMSQSANANGGKGLYYYSFETAKLSENTSNGGFFPLGGKDFGRLDSGYYSTNYPFALAVMSDDNEIFKAGETQ